RYNNEYILQSVPFASASAKVTSDKSISFETWHRRLGHLSHSNIQQLSKLTDISIKPTSNTSPVPLCETCELAKSKRHISRIPATRTITPLQLVHSDLSGKFSVPSFGGSHYYIIFIDDYTRFSCIYFLKKKSDAFDAFLEYKSYMEKQSSFS